MDKSKVQAIKNRDGNRCRRCCSAFNLEIHHIHQKTLGGGDEDENLITLCHNCHREWHRHEPQFDVWLLTPSPALFLASQVSNPGTESMMQIPKAWEMIKALNNAEADDLQLHRS